MASLPPGSRLGPYEIVGPLGQGGMGEVYRARDTKLGRDVAIKIVPEAFANDAERLARFEREAQVLASLNHPHIAQVYGLEGSGLVMELVEGEDLSQRIARGPIPLDEALPIARQIAEALEAAHDQNIIHRDLKPANVKLRPDGTVKVLDFGLAKMVESASSDAKSAEAAYSPTISLGATRAGVILGTAAYMAPEQARGRFVDKRVDVWAFGVVFYEMLTGTRAFPGDDVSDTLATVLKFEPDWNRLPPDTPSSIRRLLRRCLVKDPKLRLRECGSALVEIHDASTGDAVLPAAAADAARTGRRWMLPAASAVLLAALAGIGGWSLGARPAAAPQPTRRFTITLPESDSLPISSGPLVALSPDDKTLVYRARRGEALQWFRRPLDQFDATVIPGSEGAGQAFFSPDGSWLGFVVSNALKKVALSGGPAQILSTLTTGFRGAWWGPDGIVVSNQDRLWTIPAAGGEPTELFKTGANQQVSQPQVLAGGKAVLFALGESRPDESELHLLTVASGEHRTIMPIAAAGRVTPSGHLVFVRGGALWAVPFDMNRLEANGTPVPVVNGVRVEGGGGVQYAVSDAGSLVYISGAVAASANHGLMFVGREGTPEVLAVPKRDYQEVALSPDRTRVAVQIGSGEDADVWVAETTRGTLTRLTTEAGFDGWPLWSPDGKRVVFASSRNGSWTFQRKAADGTGDAEILATFDKVGRVRPYAWSSDGTNLVFEIDSDIAMVAGNGKEKWRPIIHTSAYEGFPAVSPDGRWIAYTSNETGLNEIYLQPFPKLGDRRVVSVGGGYSPTWSRNGGQLFYLRGGPPNAVMRVDVQAGKDGRADIGKPEVFAQYLFYSARGAYRLYDVTPDGQRLLVIAREGEDAATTPSRQINVVLNWFDELKRLVPTPAR